MIEQERGDTPSTSTPYRKKALQKYQDGSLHETSGYKVGAQSGGAGVGAGHGLGGGRRWNITLLIQLNL